MEICFSFEKKCDKIVKRRTNMELKMYEDAITEYLDAIESNSKFLQENLKLSCENAEAVRKNAEENIRKLLKANGPYARLLMDLKHITYKDDNLYSLTEIAKKKDSKNPSYIIQAWLRDVKTLELLCLWEKEHNQLFNLDEADRLIAKTKEPSFTMTAKVWIENTDAQGIVSKQGKGGGTLARHEIAIDFITWLFPEKRYELSKMIINRILQIE